MQTLSRVLGELYDLAEQAPMPRFPAQAMAMLKQLVEFDGALLGKGIIGGERMASVHENDQIPACKTLRVSAVAELSTPGCGSCNCELSEVDRRDLTGQECQSAKIMLSGDLPKNERGDWLMLCRTSGKKFALAEKRYLLAAWPHVTRALAINRQRFLEMQHKQLEDCAIALISAAGTIEAADPRFNEVLSVEWPSYAGEALPQVVLECWNSDRPYVGARTEISLYQQAGSLFCIAKPYLTLAGLTKTERTVAQYFASGLNHKEVAQLLGVSQNTVRTHLKQAYSKLGIHDKAQLANRFAAASGRISGIGQGIAVLPKVK